MVLEEQFLRGVLLEYLLVPARVFSRGLPLHAAVHERHRSVLEIRTIVDLRAVIGRVGEFHIDGLLIEAAVHNLLLRHGLGGVKPVFQIHCPDRDAGEVVGCGRSFPGRIVHHRDGEVGGQVRGNGDRVSGDAHPGHGIADRPAVCKGGGRGLQHHDLVAGIVCGADLQAVSLYVTDACKLVCNIVCRRILGEGARGGVVVEALGVDVHHHGGHGLVGIGRRRRGKGDAVIRKVDRKAAFVAKGIHILKLVRGVGIRVGKPDLLARIAGGRDIAAGFVGYLHIACGLDAVGEFFQQFLGRILLAELVEVEPGLRLRRTVNHVVNVDGQYIRPLIVALVIQLIPGIGSIINEHHDGSVFLAGDGPFLGGQGLPVGIGDGLDLSVAKILPEHEGPLGVLHAHARRNGNDLLGIGLRRNDQLHAVIAEYIFQHQLLGIKGAENIIEGDLGGAVLGHGEAVDPLRLIAGGLGQNPGFFGLHRHIEGQHQRIVIAGADLLIFRLYAAAVYNMGLGIGGGDIFDLGGAGMAELVGGLHRHVKLDLRVIALFQKVFGGAVNRDVQITV